MLPYCFDRWELATGEGEQSLGFVEPCWVDSLGEET